MALSLETISDQPGGGPSTPGSVTLPVTTRCVLHERYGGPDVLRVGEREIGALEPDQVLVRIHASSVNPVEWYGVAGFWIGRFGNGLRVPRSPLVGADLAGRVVAVGSGVTSLQVGDEVFGTGAGAWGEHAVARETKVAPKPPAVSFEDAAAVPIAGLTALQAVRDKGNVQPGSCVLINGASGGVGTFAVQLARWLGADVTAVCSTPNVDLARSLGANRVVDYRQEDFTKLGERHDVMIDIAGSRPFRQFRRVLAPDATVVVVGAPLSTRGLGPLSHIIGTKLAAIGRRQSVVFFVAKINREDLALMAELLVAGTVRTVIDRRFEGLGAAPDGLLYLGEGHARGKIVISV